MITSEVMTYPLPDPISRTLCVMVGKWLGVRDGRGRKDVGRVYTTYREGGRAVHVEACCFNASTSRKLSCKRGMMTSNGRYACM
jgi:hypothetical protein